MKACRMPCSFQGGQVIRSQKTCFPPGPYWLSFPLLGCGSFGPGKCFVLRELQGAED